MSIRSVKLVPGEYYHIYNRGNGKNKIFLDKEDYDRFIKLLYVCNSKNKFNFRDSIISNKMDAFDFERGESIVFVLAWVLMPNHFHIFITSPSQDLGEEDKEYITKYIHKISTAYVMYFNKKYKRTGSLFEGKFKSRHIGKENYFNYLFAYIHLNPLKLIQKDWKENGIKDKQKAKEYLSKYQYSSFQDYFGNQRRGGTIINKNSVPKHIIKSHINDIFEWIKIPLGKA